MMTAKEFGESLIESIKCKDVKMSFEKIQQFENFMKDPLVGSEYSTWISEPVNLTNVHKVLIEELEIPPRAMAIKKMLMSRTQRAMLLVKAMGIAVKRVHKL